MKENKDALKSFNDTRLEMQTALCEQIGEVIEHALTSSAGYTPVDILGCLEVVKTRYAIEGDENVIGGNDKFVKSQTFVTPKGLIYLQKRFK